MHIKYEDYLYSSSVGICSTIRHSNKDTILLDRTMQQTELKIGFLSAVCALLHSLDNPLPVS